MSLFKCEICLQEFTVQIEFYRHLRAHYEIEIASVVHAGPPVIMSPSRPTAATKPETFDSINAVIDQVIASIMLGTSQSIQDDGVEEIVDEEPTYTSEFPCFKCPAEFEDQREFVEHANSCRVGTKDDEASGIPPSDMHSILNHDYMIKSAELVDNGTLIRDLDVEAYPVDGIDQEEADAIIKAVDSILGHDHDHGCIGCVEIFSSKAKLEAHLKRFHPELSKPRKRRPPAKRGHKVLKCDNFNQNSALAVEHKRSHTGNNPNTCDICGKSFSAANALKKHMRIHSGEKPFACEHCGKDFGQLGNLKYHLISIHSNLRPYKCEFCDKGFSRKFGLDMHRLIHTEQRDFKCEFCEKRFRSSTSLKKHTKIHTVEKRIPCSICGRPFKTRTDMKKHIPIHIRRARRGIDRCSANKTNNNNSVTATEPNNSSSQEPEILTVDNDQIVTEPNNPSSQEPEILTVDNDQIAIINGETIQMARLSDEGHLTMAGEPLTIVAEWGAEENGSAVSPFPLTAIGTGSSMSSQDETTTVTSMASSQLETGIAYPMGEGAELEAETIMYENSETLHLWPWFRY